MKRQEYPSPREGTGRNMEPFLLVALADQPSYGYELAQMVAALGFRRAAEDPSIVYKVLRGLEEQGRLTSTWKVGDEGPPRRLYQLTPVGEDYLDTWAVDLQRQQARITVFFDRYRKRFPHRQSATASEPLTQPEEGFKPVHSSVILNQEKEQDQEP